MIRATRRVIRKGDGVVFLHDGEGDWGRFPPPESLSDDPDTPDIPPYAHSGHHHAEETEHKTPGVGHVLEGKWTKGPHGGAMFVDGADGVHFHGLDGVIHAIGEFFKRRRSMGLPAPPPSEAPKIVQKGHDTYNLDAVDKLPAVDSPEWRKTYIGPYQGHGDTKHLERRIRSPDGNLITGTFNRNGDQHHLGTHVESMANYGHLHIADEVAKACGMSGRKEVMNSLEMLKYPHILPQALTFRMSPDGKLHPRAMMIPQNQLRDKAGQFPSEMSLRSQHMDQFGPGGMTDKRAFPRLLSWGLHEELPDPYYMGFSRGRGRRVGSTMFTDPETKRKMGLDSMTSGLGMAKHTILDAIGGETHPQYFKRQGIQYQNPEDYRDITWTNENGEDHSLADILQNAKDGDHRLLDEMIIDMGDVPALHKLFGRVQDSSPVTALDNFYKNHPDYRGRAHLKHEQIKSHTGHESKDNHLYHRVNKETGGLIERPSSFNLHGQDGIKSAFAILQASGRNPEAAETGAQGNWRNHDIDDATLASGTEAETGAELRNNRGNIVPFDTSTRGLVSARRSIIGALADMTLASRGDTGHRPAVMSDEEFNAVAPLTTNKFSNLNLHGQSFPDYFTHRAVTPDLMSMGDTPTPAPAPAAAAAPLAAATPPPVAAARPPPVGATPASTLTPATKPPPVAVAGPAENPMGLPTTTEPTVESLTPAAPVKVSPQQIVDYSDLNQMPLSDAASSLQQLPFAQKTPMTRRQTKRAVQGLQPKVVIDPRTNQPRVMHQSMITQFMPQVRKGETKAEAESRILKTVERIQMLDALNDDSVIKHVPNSKLSETSVFDVNYMAEKMELTSADVRAIIHSKGDWHRVAKTYQIPETTVKAVKVAFRSD